MKSEERHELQQNDLVGSLAGLYIFLRKYGVYILLVAALCVLAVEVVHIRRQAAQAKLQSAWIALQNAVSPHQLQTTVLDKYKFPAVDARAYVKIGAIYLQAAGNTYLASSKRFKPTRAQAIAGAKIAFKKVIADYPGQQLAVVRSKLGLALAYEDAGQWAKAATIYRAFARKGATAMEKSFAPLAAYRLAHLSNWRSPVLAGPAIDLSMPKAAPAAAKSAATQAGKSPAAASMPATTGR